MIAMCLNRWESVKGTNFRIITDSLLNHSPREFQRIRRIYPEWFRGESPEYILTDDDMYLPEDFDLEAALKVFRRSGFSVMSLLPSNAVISRWTPEGYSPDITEDWMEHYASGGTRFCRRGYLPLYDRCWPPMGNGPGYDTVHGEAIRANGGKIGYFMKFKAEHLGEGLSTVWNQEKLNVG